MARICRGLWPWTRTAPRFLRPIAPCVDDTAILDIGQIVAYCNDVNRLADGLGVELEDECNDDDLTLTRDEFDARRSGA